MRDSLVFTAERRNDHLAAICHGHDRQGRPVEFELDPSVLYDNLRRQADWAAKVSTIEELLRSGIKAGIAADTLWQVFAVLLPADLTVDTAWESAEPVEFGADGPDELVEDGHDPLGYPVYRQR